VCERERERHERERHERLIEKERGYLRYKKS
jgi:hypothetical protein